MSNRTGILKTQLASAEQSANTTERIVLHELKVLATLKTEEQVAIQEASILRKLHRLDERQDEIDRIVRELKELGEYQYADYSEAKYIYKRPKVQKPKAEPKKPRKPRKVYPINSPTPAKLKERQAQAAAEKKAAREAERQTKAAQRAQEAAERKAQREAEREAARLEKALRRAEEAAIRKASPRPRVVTELPSTAKALNDAKHRAYDNQKRLDNLDATIDKRRIDLERRLEERKAYLAKVADIPQSGQGAQKRHTARTLLQNVENQLAELDEYKAQKQRRITELIARANNDVIRLEKELQML
ncbi:hypothetical protein [Arthrobacter sp. QXT-31]|uniref:hypothetical protein n=1 Tax=Arthrobacter sp. QXT-31 TaxID=1357915 RepID=UPI00097193CF|nr:hypothetical protein [Arthrobacter sp. QXT-31]APX03379.1 hypothetical protein BWQ92_18110 [Arthrobacter sp. QXT-31]